MTTHHIETARGQFFYRKFGNDGLPKIVMLHGWPQTSYCWKEVAQLLENNYQCYSLDLRGCGDSNRELDKNYYHKNEMGKDMIAVLGSIGISDFFLAGHDWGGGVAQEVAFQIPNRVKKLVVINFPIINNLVGQKAAYERLGKRLFSPFWYQFFLGAKYLPEQFLKGNEDFWVRYTVRGLVHEIDETSLKEYVRCHQIPNSIITMANLYRTMKDDMKRWASTDYVSKKHPMETLMIHGEKDQVIVEEYYLGIENCFENVKLASVNTGHFVMDEDAEAVTQLLRDFFKS